METQLSSPRSVNRDAELDHIGLVYLRHTRMRVVTRHPLLEEAMRNRLTYRHISWERGKPRTDLVPVYEIDRLGRNNHYITGVGFLPMIAEMAQKLDCPLEVYDVITNRRQDIWRLDPLAMRIPRSSWDSLRSWQQDAVRFVRCYRRGRFGVATGSGKSFLIRTLGTYLKGYRILITAFGKQNLRDLWRDCVEAELDAQFIDGQTRSSPTSRIICCTTGSLGRVADIRFDIAFGDEVHEHAAPGVNSNLWQVQTDRFFGFSANMEDRSDNADMWSEAIYGPVLLHRTYQDNVLAGDVAPIRVRMLDMYRGPSCQSKQRALRDRVLLWTNQHRNKEFVDVAKYHIDRGRQVLLLTNTTEHSLWVRKLLNVPVVFRDPNIGRQSYFANKGLLQADDDFSEGRNDRLAEAFAERKIPCVIANKLWRQGKDFPSLDVLCRMDAMTSKIACTQASGRLSRVAEGKECGYLIDSRDQFDKGLNKTADTREEFYVRNGWEIS